MPRPSHLRSARPLSRKAASKLAGRLASCCYDFMGATVVRISDPRAIEVLTAAFSKLLASGGSPVAIPVPTEDARHFPRYARTDLPVGRWWLAVGFDAEGRGCYALQSALADDASLADLAAKSLALSKLALTASKPGFPIGQPKGRA